MTFRIALLILSTVFAAQAQPSAPRRSTAAGLSFWAIECYKNILHNPEVAEDLRLSARQQRQLEPILYRDNHSTTGFVYSGIMKDYELML
ncbi:MAG TPA: hypothetical protein VFG14_11630 [Chthoniobacteraceae bacterium]|nr:hypothetical protein [Chthoniobacteraceae bacterium]